eukprot:scaffold54690_cov69-Cyclotella_meneghiniana.AAC.4
MMIVPPLDRYMRNELDVLKREQIMSPKTTTPPPQSKSPAAVLQSELTINTFRTNKADYQEDLALRDNTKWSRYSGTRPIFWDMTIVSAVQFSNADLQRAVYSNYYGENCWKGGVGIQLFGWTSFGLFVGWRENDRVEGKLIPFTNGLDNGYRANMAAWRNGKQMAIETNYIRWMCCS